MAAHDVDPGTAARRWLTAAWWAVRARVRLWSLQTKLMITIIGMIAIMFAVIGISVDVLVTRQMESGLDANGRAASDLLRLDLSGNAAVTLLSNREHAGTMLLIATPDGNATGAYVGQKGEIHVLTGDHVDAIVNSVAAGSTVGQRVTATVPGLGAYRLIVDGAAGTSRPSVSH